MQDSVEKKRLAILRIINKSTVPIGSTDISLKMQGLGFEISERTVRFHLNALDKDGFTEYLYKKGRVITEFGKTELSNARAYEQIGFLTTRINQMTYKMNFNLSRMEGTVLLNMSLLHQNYLKKSAPFLKRVFEHGYGMGKLMTLIEPGGSEDMEIPEGYVGIGTVCSITINGILLTHGIPTQSIFGGLLQLEKNEPSRFVALINYDGTSLDPLEIFIKSGMTDYDGATTNGNGLIGASFREMPQESRSDVEAIAKKLESIHLGGFFRIGYPGKSLCGIPVNNGAFGSIIIGGLNPVALLVENGIPVESKALSGLIDFKKLFHYSELDEHVKRILK